MLELHDDWGEVHLTIDECAKNRHISKDKLARLADLHHAQLALYFQDKAQRIDMGVLARICYALNCDVSDVLFYTRPGEQEPPNSD